MNGRYSWRCWCQDCRSKRRMGVIVALAILTALVVGFTTAGWNYYGGWQ